MACMHNFWVLWNDLTVTVLQHRQSEDGSSGKFTPSVSLSMSDEHL